MTRSANDTATTGIPQTSSLPHLSSRRTLLLAGSGLSLIAVCYGLARFAYGLFVPAFRSTFDMSAAAAGTIASSSYVAYCLGIVLATVGTSRWGPRAVAVCAGAAATAGTGLIALSPNPWVLAVGVVIAGSSTGMASPPLAEAIAHRVAPRVRDRVQTVVNAGTGAGVLVSGPVALLANDQWRGAWFAFAGLAAAATIWAAVTIPAVPMAAPAPAARRGRHASATTQQPPPAPASRTTLALVCSALTFGMASAAVWTFGQDLLTSASGMSRTHATITWIVLGACGLLGAAAGDAARRWGAPAAWTALMTILGASTALLAAAPGSFPLALLASGVFGATYIALTGVLLLWGASTQASPARGVGAAFLFLAVGQAGASPVLGALADRFDLPAAFWVASVVALAGAALRPPPARPRQASSASFATT